jgi:hypothetical protein
LTEIRTYTLAQLRAFTEAAERARKRSRVDELMDLRASQYDGKTFSKYLKKLID